ncbi:hypothetical protein RchiOBHm_Chr2g0119661 [Rosa chinensis]|uniref:Uncharacterized protein n=1 Tax=Rosa chinensis TaxID=74649 RepID=A0A2P6RS44_ROSCH|nr:hypothetical protein RchiOBHm_Chr2g0119661 [Rosa chinensis]
MQLFRNDPDSLVLKVTDNKEFEVTISKLRSSQMWTRIEKQEWGDVFDILKRPRLVRWEEELNDWGFGVLIFAELGVLDDSDTEVGFE